MKSISFLLFIILLFFCKNSTAQLLLNDTVVFYHDYKVEIKQTPTPFLSIFKNNQLVLLDSISSETINCTGFSFPFTQPNSSCFIFSKHEKKAGKTYLLYPNDTAIQISGGSFWAKENDAYLFLLSERAHENLTIFDVSSRKIILEKFNCDVFIDWYYYKGEYFGAVGKECGDEYKNEHEVLEWLHPIEVESFNVKFKTLEETHKSEKIIKSAKKLTYFAYCK